MNHQDTKDLLVSIQLLQMSLTQNTAATNRILKLLSDIMNNEKISSLFDKETIDEMSQAYDLSASFMHESINKVDKSSTYSTKVLERLEKIYGQE